MLDPLAVKGLSLGRVLLERIDMTQFFQEPPCRGKSIIRHANTEICSMPPSQSY